MAVAAPPVPDSPRSSESPPPTDHQREIEEELAGLANALFNLGTTVVSDLSKERDRTGSAKPVGPRVNDVQDALRRVDRLSENVRTMIPDQVLMDIDSGKNPMQLTRERLERAATENQFMNGKIAAIESYRRLLDEALVQNFPELAPFLDTPEAPSPEMTGVHAAGSTMNGPG